MSAPSRPSAWRKVEGGLLVSIRATPKASKNEVTGAESNDGRAVLKVRVTAAPDKGKANAALIKLLAKWLNVPKSMLEIRAGAASRNKTIFIAGDPSGLAARLDRALLKNMQERRKT